MSSTNDSSAPVASSLAALPQSLPPEVEKVFWQALHDNQIGKGFGWVLHNMGEDSPEDLLTAFIERYEDQVVKAGGGAMEPWRSCLHAAMVTRCLAVLHRFRLEFAQKGYNFVFLETWLKKRQLAAILGISTRDVDHKIYLSGRKPPVFLADELDRLVPETFLKRMR